MCAALHAFPFAWLLPAARRCVEIKVRLRGRFSRPTLARHRIQDWRLFSTFQHISLAPHTACKAERFTLEALCVESDSKSSFVRRQGKHSISKSSKCKESGLFGGTQLTIRGGRAQHFARGKN